jgi:hypothetical protein
MRIHIIYIYIYIYGQNTAPGTLYVYVIILEVFDAIIVVLYLIFGNKSTDKNCMNEEIKSN